MAVLVSDLIGLVTVLVSELVDVVAVDVVAVDVSVVEVEEVFDS